MAKTCTPGERFADLQRQGFMRGCKPARPVKPPAPIVACDECQNWHRQGKHTADAATRKANRKAAKERSK